MRCASWSLDLVGLRSLPHTSMTRSTSMAYVSLYRCYCVHGVCVCVCVCVRLQASCVMFTRVNTSSPVMCRCRYEPVSITYWNFTWPHVSCISSSVDVSPTSLSLSLLPLSPLSSLYRSLHFSPSSSRGNHWYVNDSEVCVCSLDGKICSICQEGKVWSCSGQHWKAVQCECVYSILVVIVHFTCLFMSPPPPPLLSLCLKAIPRLRSPQLRLNSTAAFKCPHSLHIHIWTYPVSVQISSTFG